MSCCVIATASPASRIRLPSEVRLSKRCSSCAATVPKLRHRPPSHRARKWAENSPFGRRGVLTSVRLRRYCTVALRLATVATADLESAAIARSRPRRMRSFEVRNRIRRRHRAMRGNRVDERAVLHQAIVEVRAGREAGRTDSSDELALPHRAPARTGSQKGGGISSRSRSRGGGEPCVRHRRSCPRRPRRRRRPPPPARRPAPGSRHRGGRDTDEARDEAGAARTPM